jgi:hypothetical protein
MRGWSDPGRALKKSKLRARQKSLACAVVEPLESRWLLSVNVLTWHNDNTRQGLNNNEIILTPSNVNSSSFGKLFSYSVTGQVYAQPLYVSNLAIPGKGTLDVVFVATMNNDVYAFNADSDSGPGEGLLWHVNLGPAASVPSVYIGDRYGPDHDTTPQVGITSTPVIDLSNGTMYVDAFTNDVPGQDIYSHHIHALNITTGADEMTPMLVAASVPGNGVGGNGTTVTFSASQQLQRVALTLLDGVVYVGYGAFADTDPYHGWVLGFNESNLQLVSVMNTSPNLLSGGSDNPGESGIWQSGAGLSSDGTHLFFVSGNGDFDNTVGDYGDSVVEIAPDSSTQANPELTGYGVGVDQFFTPYNQLALANADADLGSGGSMILPTQPGANPDEMIAAGKQGTIYLINRDGMGGYSSSTNNDIQEVSLGHGEWGSPAYFNGSIYYHAVGDVLKRFSLMSNGMLSAAPAASGAIAYTSQGGTPSISSDGTANGIAWDVNWDASNQVLYAYDATTLTELYSSNMNASRDQMDAGVKFITPTIANGHVYVGSSDALTVYGELTPVTTPPAAPSNITATATAASSVTVNWIDNSDNESAFLVERSTDNVNFAQIGMSSANTPTYTDNTVSPNTLYYYRVRATNTIGDSAYTVPSASVMTPPATSATDIYHFDEGSGTTTVDSANANNGTLTGTTLPQWVTPGELGPAALSFSGDGIYNQTANESAVTVSNDLSPVLGSTSTLDVWVKTTQTGNAYHYMSPAITGVDQNGGNNDIDWGTLDGTGHIGLYVGDAGGVYSTYPVNDGKWHNIAMTRNSTTGLVQLYVDGVLNASAMLDTGNKTSKFNLIGALSDVASDGVTRTGDNYFNGELDEVRVYNAVLGPSEIDSLALVPAAPVLQTVTAEPGPVVHLTFTSSSTFAQNLEIDRKTGNSGTYIAIETVTPTTTVYDDSNVIAGTTYYYEIKAIDNAGSSITSNVLGATPPAATVVGNFIFYNNSKFDGQNGSSNLTDDNAIAPDKMALLPGQTATYQNITDYSKGINGIMVDVANLVNLPRLDDFQFMVGNDNNPADWTQAPTPTYINSYPGRGPGGSTQITVIWNDNTIQNEWLQVTVLAQPHLNLTADDVFYFGNMIGDTGSSPTSTLVTSTDVNLINNNQTASAPLSDPYDLNRDGAVDSTDASIAAANESTPPLDLISLTSAGTLPTVATPASTTPGTVTGTSANLSVLGADGGGEQNLTYTWSTSGTPPAPVSFSANGTNASKNVTATFITAGIYNFQVTITNNEGLSAVSDVSVPVNQTATSVAVTPASGNVPVNTTTQFSATVLDQFGIPMANQPSFNWSVSSGSGTISSSGLFAAARTAASSTITATASGFTGSSTIKSYYDTLAWYQMDASSGNALTDSSGLNQTATLTGATSFVSGVSGNALNFSGGYASLPTGVVAGLNDFTVAAWINVTTLAAWERIFDFGTGETNYMFMSPDNGATGTLRFAITDSGNGGEQQLNGPAITPGVWTHVAVTLAGNVGTLYVNGVEAAQNTNMTLHPTNLGVTTQNYLGKSQFPDPAYAGSIDDFRIYSKALSAAQILQLAAPGIVAPAVAATTTVTTTSTALSVLGSDVTAGESALTYTWAATGTPPAPVAFGVNGTNASKNTVATFFATGTYTLQVTIENPTAGIATTSSVTVSVVPTASGDSITRPNPSLAAGLTEQLSAAVVDQFGNAISTLANVTWSISSGGGSITPSGLYIAPLTGGTATIVATPLSGSSVNTTVTTVGPSAWYLANSSSGTNLVDSSGNNKNGVLSGAAGFGPGVSGNALSLTGGNAILPTGIVAGLTNFTIAAWIKVTTLNNWERVFDFGTGTNVYMFLTPDNGATNTLRYAITTGSAGGEQQLNGPAITPGVWTHVAVTLSGTTGTLYVNGMAVATNTAMTLNPSNLGTTNQNYLGKSQWAPDPAYSGSIDDFRIYGRALSASEIAQLSTPVVINAAAPAAAPFYGTFTTTLSALGADASTGAAALVYAWSTTGAPPGTATFTNNGTNAGQNTSVTVTAYGTYNFLVTITNSVGRSVTSAISVTFAPTLPAVSSYTVNDGSVQRSMVDAVTVVFTQPVTLASGALSLDQMPTDGGAGIPMAFNQSSPDGGTTWILSFSALGYVGNSLPDGTYNLTLKAASITNSSSETLSGGNQTFSFYRLYGDFYGNGSVNGSDFAALASVFGKTVGATGVGPYWYIDYNADGIINGEDFAEFAARFGTKANIPAVQPAMTPGALIASVDTLNSSTSLVTRDDRRTIIALGNNVARAPSASSHRARNKSARRV